MTAVAGPAVAPVLPDRPIDRIGSAPALAAGLAAFAIGNGLGALSLARNTRGASLDWGGFYAQGVRLTGPWTVVDRRGSPGAEVTLRAESVTQSYGSFRAVRLGDDLRVTDETTAHPTDPRLSLHRTFTAPSGAPGTLAVRIEFTPFLAPVLLEGIRPPEFRLERDGTTIRISAGPFALAYDAVPLPTEIVVNGAAWNGERCDGPIRSIAFTHGLKLPAGGSAELRILVGGGRRNRHPSGPVGPLVDQWAPLHREEYVRWTSATPTLEIPEAPELVRGYELGRSAVRALYTCPEPGFQGLVAGYPWYAALWCRDLARNLPAVLWLGDAGWAAASLDTVFAFQAPQRLEALGATAGELPMQLSPGPVFLYGTSDTSLYYPGLVRRYLAHTGDGAGARRWFPMLERVRKWGEAKLDPTTGLFRNGGELEGIEEASESERVRLGVDAFDTTIWDSADRRDHAVDLQLLWLELLRDLGSLADLPESPPTWTALGERARDWGAGLAGRYRWPDESYLYDSLRRDGAPVAKLRPNALQWVGQGLLPLAEERQLVARALRDDLTTPWGVRTLSSADPSYDPQAYHMGQVWGIATAWLARAALRTGATRDGAETLTRIARQIVAEGGWANECYRGDRPEPYDSCFLLGFSVAPFLTTLFEELFGLSPLARHGVLEVRPAEPRPFARMALRGLRVAGGCLDLAFDRDGLEARWEGPEPLVLAGRNGSLRLPPGATGRLAMPIGSQPS